MLRLKVQLHLLLILVLLGCAPYSYNRLVTRVAEERVALIVEICSLHFKDPVELLKYKEHNPAGSDQHTISRREVKSRYFYY